MDGAEIMSGQRVSRDDLEKTLEQLRGSIDHLDHGIHGPGTTAWRLARESANFAGAGRAVLLQLAHPGVASAIAQHSRTRDDVRGRFVRTFRHVYTMLFDDFDKVARSARAVYAGHERVVGTVDGSSTSYAANDPASLRWVWATLTDTVCVVQARLGVAAPRERRRYYLETRRFAALFGLAPDYLPADYFELKHYMARVLAGGELQVTAAARDMARFLLGGTGPYLWITASMLPLPLLREFGLGVTPAQQKVGQRLLGLAGLPYRLLPAWLRAVPAYRQALRRLGH